MKQPKLYFIPGMGADYRLFEGLRREGLDFEVLEFIPAKKKETLGEYALRLADKIDQNEAYVIGGVSLGGTMATEIALHLQPQKLILISSAKRSSELPPYFRLCRYLPVHLLFSGRFMAKNGPRAHRRTMEPWQADILDDMRKEADSDFIEWAVNAIVNWKQKAMPRNYIHLHGTRDFMLPGLFVGNRKKYKGGKHVMVLTTHAAEIVAEIQAEMSKLTQTNFDN